MRADVCRPRAPLGAAARTPRSHLLTANRYSFGSVPYEFMSYDFAFLDCTAVE